MNKERPLFDAIKFYEWFNSTVRTIGYGGKGFNKNGLLWTITDGLSENFAELLNAGVPGIVGFKSDKIREQKTINSFNDEI